MFIPFDTLNPTSRAWIFMPDRFLTAGEETQIMELGKQFVNQWTAHNQELLASFTILNHLFLVIAVDESMNQAGGCSIDKEFAFIRQLEKDFQLQLLDRKAVAYEQDGKIILSSIAKLEKEYKEGRVNEEVITYNNLVQTKGDLEKNWRIPMRKSWLMQLI